MFIIQVWKPPDFLNHFINIRQAIKSPLHPEASPIFDITAAMEQQQTLAEAFWRRLKGGYQPTGDGFSMEWFHSDASWEDFRDDFIILEQQLKLEGRPTKIVFLHLPRPICEGLSWLVLGV